MSLTYLTKIFDTNDSEIEENDLPSLNKAIGWADDTGIKGDTVVILEGYKSSDGITEELDVVMEWKVS